MRTPQPTTGRISQQNFQQVLLALFLIGEFACFIKSTKKVCRSFSFDVFIVIDLANKKVGSTLVVSVAV
jgi:hypothetical protein